ncbi:UDP-N-acetylmuramoyl-L-alanyl-D-glutamate--2,6-diaminopimelate ligase [Kiloniella laminariae]|uniref:UDP-N-acetylmuramoyl-L-alanyl-D-glutamate--2,6-diaminopimelate ligase n=1 Tax=Kiloniella laminariae TaxID=454162 RepID=A0ABT4LDW6_9PROT|nr:UDP-N-acetylmuramoyl-L-alanyl-D-glutamate--2,6-diaminopimelate ligase [Kiloniella laminariae]MCZ4279298.1 UDP-N-acetylmuramoyl-L-alanyl-D-glutamate--2,6-diaminopimelate ligase [Kiloniella laminariae]
MRLVDLLTQLPEDLRPRSGLDASSAEEVGTVEISGLALDSRKVQEGYLFAALPTTNPKGLDGCDFIPQALENGATVLLVPRGRNLDVYRNKAIILESSNPRQTIALLAAAYNAAQPQNLVAITGTNGKTSIATFTRQIWELLGHKAASLGTLGLFPPLPNAPAALTTPDSIGLFACLKDLCHEGITHLALEASSHGLDQYRLDGLKLKAAAFTNLTRDHLDYHGDMESYFQAKAQLFNRLLPRGGTAVLNADMPEYARLAELCAQREQKIISYGHGVSDLQVIEQTPGLEGQSLVLSLFGQTYELDLNLAGSFQASNIMAALGLVLSCGARLEDILAVLPALKGVPGRAENVGSTPRGGAVYVDYAHTPDALETVINALRPHSQNKLSVIIGCGGDRDPGKRPLMGEIAARLSDQAYITDDNPRTEDPVLIRAAMMAAAPGAIEIDDRRKAIFQAVADLRTGDLLIIAGKGHESGQIIGDKVFPFDDRKVAREAIAALNSGGPK